MKSQAPEEIKKLVRDKYASISQQNSSDKGCCSSLDTVEYSVFADDYSGLKGYIPDADLGLGCGLPTEFAKLKPGQTVVDLGSGAGNDCFVARQEVGESGRVIGLDMTDSMIKKARINAEKLGYNNVEFVTGDIENIPLESNLADVVVSNCVLNLVPNKKLAFEETFRILKPGGHFSISDIVTIGELPEELKKDAEMYAGCVAGAIDKDQYLDIVKKTGFLHINVQKLKEIQLPDEILLNYLKPEGVEIFRKSGIGIYSITVYAEKV